MVYLRLLILLILVAPDTFGQVPDNVPADTNYVILFEEGSIDIAPGYKPRLYLLADSLISNPDIQIHIRGHVCCVKKNRLARKRAKRVYKQLIAYGVSKHRMTYKGYKNTIPVIFPEETEEDELANMRVDFIFYQEGE